MAQFTLSPFMLVLVLQNPEVAAFLKFQLSSSLSGMTTYGAAARAVWMTVFHWLGMKIFAVLFALSVVECITLNSMWKCADSRNFRSMISISSTVRTVWWRAATKWFLFCLDQVSEYRMTCFIVCGQYERYSMRQVATSRDPFWPNVSFQR